MTKSVKIAGRTIGEGKQCFIIAEAGVNHNGDFTLAKKLIDAASKAGADAVKFQTFITENLVTRNAAKASYQKEATSPEESQFDMIKKLELPRKDWRKLSAYARQKGIIFLSTPDDRESADLLNELDIPAFKIGSGEITNFPLLKYIAGKNKPIILSTGMANLNEIEEALRVIKKTGMKDIILLHCVSSYPAMVQDMNLKAMTTLKNAFKLPVGLSDHSMGINISIAAAALGACIIEKHFTLDKNQTGPDHKASLEPAELKQLTQAVKEVQKALGNGKKIPSAEETKNKKIVRRSIAAQVDIPKGTTIVEKMLNIKRPAGGIEPGYWDKIIGKKAAKNIKADTILRRDSIRGIKWG